MLRVSKLDRISEPRRRRQIRKEWAKWLKVARWVSASFSKGTQSQQVILARSGACNQIADKLQEVCGSTGELYLCLCWRICSGHNGHRTCKATEIKRTSFGSLGRSETRLFELSNIQQTKIHGRDLISSLPCRLEFRLPMSGYGGLADSN